MWMIHVMGPKGIVLTWIPGRTLLLIVSLLHKPELLETLQYTWAAGFVPVTFLLPLHIGVRALATSGRRFPRFSCAKMQWVAIWLATIVTVVIAVLLIGISRSNALNVSLGILAILLNMFNVKDAPLHLQHEDVSLTVQYVIGTNAIVFSVLALMNHLLDKGELVWAGIVSNIPLLAVVLIAGSTCRATPEAITLTGQHIYMMSYQIWPNMAFVGMLWATVPLGVDIACVLATLTMFTILVIQFVVIKKIL